MSELKIASREERVAFEPGEEITGAVYWKLDQPPDGLELRLFWYTRGKGGEDADTVETLHFDNPLQEEARPFRFNLPESPYSFSGKLISLTWALELVALPSNDVTRLDIVIAPGGREVELGTVPEKKKGKSQIAWKVGR